MAVNVFSRRHFGVLAGLSHHFGFYLLQFLSAVFATGMAKTVIKI
jgi:hypothetical protein